MIIPKIESLFDDESFAADAISSNMGIMINEHQDVIRYLTLEYEGLFIVYVNLFDDETSFRNILAEGIAQTEQAAKQIALNNLNEMAYGTAINK